MRTMRFAGGDFAFRVDSSALVVGELRGGTFAVLSISEMIPKKGAPLRPTAVVNAFADVLDEYGVVDVMCDGHNSETIKELLAARSKRLVRAPEGQAGKVATYLELRRRIYEHELLIPRHTRLIGQLKSLVSKPTSGGGTSITSPRRTGSGHGDICSALALAVWSAHRKRGQSPESLAQARAYLEQLQRGPKLLPFDQQPIGDPEADRRPIGR